VTDAFGRVASCARANWKMKAALSAGLTLFFCLPYFTLQRVTLFPARTLPLSAIDRAIDFDPRWVWAYQSVYLLLTIVPWLITTHLELRRYARGFVQLSAVGFAFFLLLPVRGPRPDVEAADLMFRILQWYDRPLNCFPSLHVGLAAYSVLVATSVSRGPSTSLGTGPSTPLGTSRMTPAARWSVVFLAGLWTAVIAYAALATKQHYAVDLPAGALLACVCYWWTWCHHHNKQRLRPARGERPFDSLRSLRVVPSEVEGRAPQRERAGVPASAGRGECGRPATARSRRSAHGTLARGGGGPREQLEKEPGSC
jgi:membrane-associated phospholipid phosphatase